MNKENAIAYATEKVKTFRDSLDGIEIWEIPNGSCDVIHTSNSNGRNHAISNGGKKIQTIRSKPWKMTTKTSFALSEWDCVSLSVYLPTSTF